MKQRLFLEDSYFPNLRMDFNKVFQNTLFNMETKDAEEATVTLKLNIQFSKEKDFSKTIPENAIIPFFKHEVSSVMQIKTKENGITGGEKVLEWDENEQAYVVKTVDKSFQLTILED